MSPLKSPLRTGSLNPFLTQVITKIKLEYLFAFLNRFKALHMLGGSWLPYNRWHTYIALHQSSMITTQAPQLRSLNALALFLTKKCLGLALYLSCGTWDALITWECCSCVWELLHNSWIMNGLVGGVFIVHNHPYSCWDKIPKLGLNSGCTEPHSVQVRCTMDLCHACSFSDRSESSVSLSGAPSDQATSAWPLKPESDCWVLIGPACHLLLLWKHLLCLSGPVLR